MEEKTLMLNNDKNIITTLIERQLKNKTYLYCHIFVFYLRKTGTVHINNGI